MLNVFLTSCTSKIVVDGALTQNLLLYRPLLVAYLVVPRGYLLTR